jgi:hypothetical protein
MKGKRAVHYRHQGDASRPWLGYQYVEGTEPDWLTRKYVRLYLAPSGPEVRAEVRIRHVEFRDHPLELNWLRRELDETPALADIGPFTPNSRMTERWDYTKDEIVARNESGDVRQVQRLTAPQLDRGLPWLLPPETGGQNGMETRWSTVMLAKIPELPPGSAFPPSLCELARIFHALSWRYLRPADFWHVPPLDWPATPAHGQ